MKRILVATLVLALTACASSNPTPDDQKTETSPATSESPTTPDATESQPAADPEAKVTPRLKVSTSGGMCMNGACFNDHVLRADGSVSFHSNTVHAADDPKAPRVRPATAEELARVDEALAAVDVAELEEGYGGCCNAHADGSDTYVTFYTPTGEEVRTVRVSSSPPPPLIELIASLRDLTP